MSKQEAAIRRLVERKERLDKLREYYQPHSKQQLILDAIKSGKKKIFVRAGRQSGKALALDTPILTPSGFKSMGDIQVGDYVFSEEGVPTLVTFVSEVFLDHDCYELTFSDGETIIADAGHRWKVSTKLDRKHNRDELKVLTTEEMSRAVTYVGESNYKIFSTLPIELEDKELPIDPYLFGVWLGDGSTGEARISTADDEILESIRGLGYETTHYKNADYGVRGLLTELRGLGLARDCKTGVSKKKDIPEVYLLSSYSQRLALVQGLMDSDGWVSKTGKLEFYNTNKNIIDKFRFLLSTLGITSKLRSKIPTLNGKPCKKCYIVSFATELPICRLDRKKKRLCTPPKRRLPSKAVYITEIKKVKTVPTKCISVDSPSHLFLAGKSLIPTHNTQQSCDLASIKAALDPGSVVSIITPSLKQANKIYWKKRTLQNFIPSSWVRKEDNSELTIFLHNGSYIELDGSENIDAHRGDKKDLVILDEYKDIDPRFFSEVIEPMFATTEGIVVIIGTPPETPNSHYRDLETAALADDSWAVVHWTSYDSPYTSKPYLDGKRRELEARGELDVFKREYLAEYTKGGKNSVFPMFSRAEHVRSTAAVQRYFQKHRDRAELYWVNDPATSTTFGGLLIAYIRDTGRVLVLDEIYAKDKAKTHTGAVYESFLTKAAPWEADVSKWQIIYDDAAGWFANELLHKCGLNSFPARKATRQKEDGIALFKSMLLNKNNVVLTELCENFAEEIENYIMLNGSYPKINDHLLDSFRYFLTFAHVVLSLAENSELEENASDILDYELSLLYEESDLPEWIQ